MIWPQWRPWPCARGWSPSGTRRGPLPWGALAGCILGELVGLLVACGRGVGRSPLCVYYQLYLSSYMRPSWVMAAACCPSSEDGTQTTARRQRLGQRTRRDGTAKSVKTSVAAKEPVGSYKITRFFSLPTHTLTFVSPPLPQKSPYLDVEHCGSADLAADLGELTLGFCVIFGV